MLVFLCHASEDKAAVRQLYRKLSSDGFDAWLDEEKLLPGQDWNREITRAVRNADLIIVCLSGSSITKSGYVQKEIRMALDVADEKPEGALFIIPARLEECIVPDRLGRYQWVDLYRDQGYSKLIKSLRYAESKKEISNNIAADNRTKVQVGISSLSIPTDQKADEIRELFSRKPQQITVILRLTGNSKIDRKRIQEVYKILVSYPGQDRFSFQIFENQKGYLVDFVNDRTDICSDMLDKLKSLLGETDPWRVEKIYFTPVAPRMK